MKTIVFYAMCMALVLLASCNCKVCDKDGYKANLCRDKYDTTQEFENDVNFLQNEGYNCE